MNLFLWCSRRELTNHLRDRALGPVQDPNAVAKDDGLAPERDLRRKVSVKRQPREHDAVQPRHLFVSKLPRPWASAA